MLLAAALSDQFRAVFSFGPRADIGDHNRSQFTFNLSDRQERALRSPIHWLEDIGSPTFVIEGQNGNASDIRDIENRSDNDNIHTFIVQGGDHFDILAPVTKLLAQKVLADTGPSVNIHLTGQEIQQAMNQAPITPMPVMIPHYNEAIGLSFLRPAIWEENVTDDLQAFVYYSPFHDENFWDTAYMVVEIFDVEERVTLQEFEALWELGGVAHRQVQVGGQEVYIWEEVLDLDRPYFSKLALFQWDGALAVVTFYVPEVFRDYAEPMFQQIVYSINSSL